MQENAGQIAKKIVGERPSAAGNEKAQTPYMTHFSQIIQILKEWFGINKKKIEKDRSEAEYNAKFGALKSGKKGKTSFSFGGLANAIKNSIGSIPGALMGALSKIKVKLIATIAGIVLALGALIYFLIKNPELTRKIGAAIGGFFVKVWNIISSWCVKASSKMIILAGIIIGLASMWVFGPWGLLVGAAAIIGALIVKHWESIRQIWNDYYPLILGLLTAAAGLWIFGPWGLVAGLVVLIVGLIYKYRKEIVDGVKWLGKAIWNGIKAIGNGIAKAFSFILSPFKKLINFFKEFGIAFKNAILGFIKKIPLVGSKLSKKFEKESAEQNQESAKNTKVASSNVFTNFSVKSDNAANIKKERTTDNRITTRYDNGSFINKTVSKPENNEAGGIPLASSSSSTFSFNNSAMTSNVTNLSKKDNVSSGMTVFSANAAKSNRTNISNNSFNRNEQISSNNIDKLVKQFLNLGFLIKNSFDKFSNELAKALNNPNKIKVDLKASESNNISNAVVSSEKNSGNQQKPLDQTKKSMISTTNINDSLSDLTISLDKSSSIEKRTSAETSHTMSLGKHDSISVQSNDYASSLTIDNAARSTNISMPSYSNEVNSLNSQNIEISKTYAQRSVTLENNSKNSVSSESTDSDQFVKLTPIFAAAFSYSLSSYFDHKTLNITYTDDGPIASFDSENKTLEV